MMCSCNCSSIIPRKEGGQIQIKHLIENLVNEEVHVVDERNRDWNHNEDGGMLEQVPDVLGVGFVGVAEVFGQTLWQWVVTKEEIPVRENSVESEGRHYVCISNIIKN